MVIRCFFTRGGHFAGVEILPEEESLAAIIRRAEALFKERAGAEEFDGFEIWDGDHLIHQRNGLAARIPTRTERCGAAAQPRRPSSPAASAASRAVSISATPAAGPAPSFFRRTTSQ